MFTPFALAALRKAMGMSGTLRKALATFRKDGPGDVGHTQEGPGHLRQVQEHTQHFV